MEEEKGEILKCETCGKEFAEFEDEENWHSIDDTGNCIDCEENK